MLAFLALLWQQLHDYYTTDLFIEQISVSTGLERAGISSVALTNKLGEHLLALIASTNNLLGNQTSSPSSIHAGGIHSSLSGETVDIEIPETKLSLKTITRVLVHFLPFRDRPSLRGDALLLDGKLVLTLAVTTRGQPTSVNTWTAKGDLASIDAVVESGARAALEIIDPIAAALNHYNHDLPFKLGLEAALRIAEGESRSPSADRARNALVLWGLISADRRKFALAFGKFQEAERISGVDANILLAEAAAWNAVGNTSESVLRVQRALGLRRTASSLVSTGDTLRGISSSKAINYYRAALGKQQGYWPAYIGLSRVAVDNENWAAAGSFAYLAIQNAPNREEQAAGWVQLGEIAQRRGRFKEALAHNLTAARLDRAAVDPYLGIGRAEYGLGFDETAADAFQLAGSVASHKASVLKEWADLLQTLRGNFSKAEQLYRLAIQEDGSYDFAHGSLGYLYFRLGRVQEAEQEFRIAVAVSSYPARLEIDWGDGLAEVGKFNESRAHYDRAVDLDPYLCEARLARARSARREAVDRNRRADVVVWYRKAFSACLYPGQVWTDWAAAVDDSFSSDDALGIYSELLTWDPGAVWARVLVAGSRSSSGVDREMQKALDAVPYPAGLHSLLARNYLWRAEPELDLADRQATISRSFDAENTKAKNVQISTSIIRGSMTRSALDSILQEVLDGGDDTFVGDILMGRGWLSEAEQVFRNSLRLAPDDAYVNWRLGVVLGRLGKADEARLRLRIAAGIYLRLGTISNDAADVYETLLSTGHRDHLSSDTLGIYEKELGRIRKWIQKPTP